VIVGRFIFWTRRRRSNRWARVPPALAWKRPGLPTEWTRVLEAMNLEPLPGYVWLVINGGWWPIAGARWIE
jgi:hypothetical protein